MQRNHPRLLAYLAASGLSNGVNSSYIDAVQTDHEIYTQQFL